jgi:Zn finger protein HypA/HybF involved in hydrogenase expression
MTELQKMENELNKRFPRTPIKILSFTKRSGPITYECVKCHKIYNKARANHMYENKTLCSKCYSGRNETKTSIAVIKLLKENKNLKWLNGPDVVTTTPLKLMCIKCNFVFERLPSNFMVTQNCPECGVNQAKTSVTEFERRIKKTFPYEKYEILKYTLYSKKALIKHECGFIISVLPSNFLKSLGCPQCTKGFSKGEKAIGKWLIEHGLTYRSQVKFPEELQGKSYDFLVIYKNRQILIEFQGIQHYEPQPFFGGEQKFIERQRNDSLKREFVKNHGYELLEIPYYEINNVSVILSQYFGFNDYPERE